jgi:4-hydroxybenzoate polyprenyltransferase
MKFSSNRLLFLKMVGLFTTIRGYNILILIIAQYLSSVFILASEKSTKSVVFDYKLSLIILCSSLAVASGYIINNFYDAQKDLINRPIKSSIDRLVSQSSKLYFYFTLNIICSLLSLFISWKALLFFSTYIFLIWLYSHKIKKMLFWGNLTAAILVIFPFFGIFLYFKNLYEVVFYHAAFLFLLVFIREMVKDLENIKGDLVNNYQTIPVVFSPSLSKKIISACVVLAVLPLYFLINSHDTGYMNMYFYLSYISLIVFLFLLQKANSIKDYLWLHNILKLIIVAGVFSIILINPNVILKSRVLYLFH